MESSILRKKLQNDLEKADPELLEKINRFIADFEYQKEQDLLMQEAEDDIAVGNLYTINEVKDRFLKRSIIKVKLTSSKIPLRICNQK